MVQLPSSKHGLSPPDKSRLGDNERSLAPHLGSSEYDTEKHGHRLSWWRRSGRWWTARTHGYAETVRLGDRKSILYR